MKTKTVQLFFVGGIISLLLAVMIFTYCWVNYFRSDIHLSFPEIMEGIIGTIFFIAMPVEIICYTLKLKKKSKEEK